MDCLRTSFEDPPYCFAEPGVSPLSDKENADKSVWMLRPKTAAEPRFQASPEGKLGNFQNWIQSAADLLELEPDAEAILICEDDAQITHGIREYLEGHLWPSKDCGAISLYCPALSHYRWRSFGLLKTQIIHSGPVLTARSNLVFSLAMLFPRKALQQIIDNPSQHAWHGSHAQAKSSETLPWERKAIDTWIGRSVLELGYTCWNFAPSLVNHYCPDRNVSNSSLGNGFNRGPRQTKNWVGLDFDVKRLPRPKLVYTEIE